MSLAELYVLASKVRSKLTREAANPKTSLRLLVLQANMLDNLMDHILLESERKKAEQAAASASSAPRTMPRVSFSLPSKPAPVVAGPSVTEYEIDYDSASDSDSDDDYDDDDVEEAASMTASHTVYYSGSDSSDSDEDDDDYYFLLDEEEDEYSLRPAQLYKKLPAFDLSLPHLQSQLSVIEEEGEEMPELAKSTSVSDSDSDIDEVAQVLGQANVAVAPHQQVELRLKADEPRLEINAHPVNQYDPSDVSIMTHTHMSRHQRHDAVYLMEHVF